MEAARAAARHTAGLSLAAQRLNPSVSNAPVRVLRGWTRERRFLMDYSAPPADIPAAAATAATAAAIAILRGEQQPQPPPQSQLVRPGRPKPPHQFGCRAAGGKGAHRRLIGFRQLRDQLPPGMPKDHGGTAAASDEVAGETSPSLAGEASQGP